jgi:hypothetical protein
MNELPYLSDLTAPQWALIEPLLQHQNPKDESGELLAAKARPTAEPRDYQQDGGITPADPRRHPRGFMLLFGG